MTIDTLETMEFDRVQSQGAMSMYTLHYYCIIH